MMGHSSAYSATRTAANGAVASRPTYTRARRYQQGPSRSCESLLQPNHGRQHHACSLLYLPPSLTLSLIPTTLVNLTPVVILVLPRKINIDHRTAALSSSSSSSSGDAALALARLASAGRCPPPPTASTAAPPTDAVVAVGFGPLDGGDGGDVHEIVIIIIVIVVFVCVFAVDRNRGSAPVGVVVCHIHHLPCDGRGDNNKTIELN